MTPRRFTLETWGDLVGRGEWTLRQDGEWVDITYDWRIRAEKPLLRWSSFALGSLFEANHRWAMARGEESLRLELARRRAAEHERDQIPPPPGPTDIRTVAVPAVGVLVLLAVIVAICREFVDNPRLSSHRR